jgi:DNA-binding NtrC family response regulator
VISRETCTGLIARARVHVTVRKIARRRGFEYGTSSDLAPMKTLSIDEKGSDDNQAPRARTWIVRIGSAGSPMGGPEMVLIDGQGRIVFGRKDDGAARGASGELLRIEVDDPWMSSAHAELVETGDGWHLRDLGSSNGTLLFGQRRSSMSLVDGDVFETGGTFWLFRSAPLSGEVEAALREEPAPDVLGSLAPAFVEMSSRLKKVARTRVPVIFLGATGTGKEVLARKLHEISKRAGAFVAINTAAIQKTLVASELFGAERGAHSTAEEARPGQIRAAEGGTFMLDEIGDMPIEVQVSLLRMLQESEVLPVGGATPIKVDVRIVCATHQNLAEMVRAGSFRADLYARIKGCMLDVPDLADRVEDIGLLIARFLEKYGGRSITFSIPAYRALLQYPWPLNVRELEKTIETAVALAARDRIELEHLPKDVSSYRVADARLKETIVPDESETLDAALEREIVRLMTVNRGNVSKVARSMGRSRMQVHRWLKRLNVDPEQFRGER